MGAQPTHDGLGVSFSPAPRHFGVPLQGDCLEKQGGSLGSKLRFLLFFHRIKVVDQQRLGFIALGPRDGERDDGVVTDDQRAFLAAGLEVAQSPRFHAVGFHEEVHTAIVE